MVTKVEYILPDPLNDIVTLAQARKQLRLESDFTDEDDLIQTYIDAAVEASEQYMNAHLYKKDMVITLDAFQKSLVFEAYPLRSVTSVEYYKTGEESLTTLETTDWYLTTQNIKQNILNIKNIPTDVAERFDAVEITLAIGYNSASKVPAPIKQAIKLQISDMYERREDRKETITTAAQSLMRAYRKYT